MPFKPLSNALLSPYKAPIEAHLYNYLITKNLRWLLNNSFFHPSPTFTLHILSIYFDRWWMLGVEWWVLMVSIKFIVNPHIIITQHSIPHIINTQHSSPNTQHPTPFPQHSTPFPQHSTFNPTHHQHPTFNPSYHQHSTFITHHPTSNTLPPTFNTLPPTFNIQPHTSSSSNIQHSSPNIQPH